MQIGFVEPHLEVFGGIRRIVELANHLVDRGHDVTIYHPEGTPCRWLECRARIEPTEVVFDRLHDALVYNDPNPRDYRVVKKATARLKVFYLLALYEKELLTGIHPTLLLRPRGHMAVTKRALGSADLVLTNATWMHRWLRDVYGIGSHLVIGGINREHFHPVEKGPGEDDVVTVLHSGDSRPRKGTDTVRAALERVVERHPELVVDTYHGRGADQSEMASVYGAAHLFVDAQRYAGWNNPVVEAMACGVPVVCTDIGGIQDFAFHEQTALLVPPDDPEALGDAVLRMIHDPDLRERLRENAFVHTKAFTWERSAGRMEAVLRAGLKRERPGKLIRLRHAAASIARRARAELLGRGVHFDKYDLRGAYHWTAYHDDPVYRAHVDYVVALLEPGGTLLDVGCGDGLIAAHLADAGFDVTGIDVEPTAIRLAQEQRPGLRFHHRNLFEMEGTYDTVVASEVIEHLPDPHAFLHTLGALFHRRALITTPQRDYYANLDPYHTSEYAYHEFAALLKQHFPRVQVEAAGGHMYGLVGHGTGPGEESGG